ncbi:MAG: hypothetical protein LBK04_07595 [Clostridiales Family XIII bacterium]|nr:hypothetical protein [Clostridiales Family XIII bacterium]
MNANIIPIIFVVVFFVLMFGIGFLSRRMIANSSDFLLAGREMSFGINSMGIFATGFAGTTIGLAPALVLMFGFIGVVMMAIAYVGVGLLFYGCVFAKGIRRSGAYTLMEWLQMRFDGKTRRILSITGFIGIVAITANNCLAMANVLTGYDGLSISITGTRSVVTFLCFTYVSGMWGVSLTDFAQAIIGLVGIPLLLIGIFTQFGYPAETAAQWEAVAGAGWFGHGINGGTIPGFSALYPSALTLILGTGVFLVWGGQHYWLRMASARNEKEARNSMIVGGVLCCAVTLFIGYIGSVAGANFGGSFTLLGGEVAPSAAYGLVTANFGMVMGGFLLVFALAASLSTAASTLMASVSIATKDLYPLFINKSPNEAQTKRAGKVATVIISVVVWALLAYPGGLVFLTAFATAWMAPAGLLFAIGYLWKKATSAGAFAGALTALIAMSIYVVIDLLKIPVGGQPIGTYAHLSIVGTVALIVPAILVSFVSKPKYFGASSWSLERAMDASHTVSLNDEERHILDLIRKGYTTTAELMDLTGSRGEKISVAIEKLDEYGYIRRDGYSGAKFWSFTITQKGESLLPELSQEDKTLEPIGLTSGDIDILGFVKEKGKSRSSQLVYDNYKDPDEAKAVAAVIVKLLRRGYLSESGFLKRWVVINDKGDQLLQQNT